MTTKTLPEVPTGMQRIFRRFERWRNSHRGRVTIPAALWASAAEAAREHGIFRTAKILHLEYGKLKRMAESATPPAMRALAPAGFLELVAPSGPGLTECVIELEGPRGKMRIQWKGTTAPDLAGLSRALPRRIIFPGFRSSVAARRSPTGFSCCRTTLYALFARIQVAVPVLYEDSVPCGFITFLPHLEGLPEVAAFEGTRIQNSGTSLLGFRAGSVGGGLVVGDPDERAAWSMPSTCPGTIFKAVTCRTPDAL